MPTYKYECKDCGLVVERHIEKGLVWCPGSLNEDEECGNKGNSTLLRKKDQEQ